jgi:hypothetical protein
MKSQHIDDICKIVEDDISMLSHLKNYELELVAARYTEQVTKGNRIAARAMSELAGRASVLKKQLPDLLTVPVMAKVMQRSVRTIRYWIAFHDIPAYDRNGKRLGKMGTARYYKVDDFAHLTKRGARLRRRVA